LIGNSDFYNFIGNISGLKISLMNIRFSSYILLIGALIILPVSCVKEEKPPSPVNDIEGNTYKTVKIDTRIWMAENLKTSLYNDGTEIQLVTDDDAWHELITPGYCWYDNNESGYKDQYGALYNGYSVGTGKLCPAGWHVPDVEEWQQLIDFLGETISAGGKLKEAGTTNWHSPNTGADNSTGFTALAGGIRYSEGIFRSVLYYTGFWSSTENESLDLWYVGLYSGDALIYSDYISKKHGFSVRCIKD
jgi:uncharacterized protein (TIGR02145 family)